MINNISLLPSSIFEKSKYYAQRVQIKIRSSQRLLNGFGLLLRSAEDVLC
jgi:hypothetical protein